jgi:site-specific DNA-methyltransferase (adenine-specific)
MIIPLEALWHHWYRIAKENAPIVLTAMQPFSSVVVMSNPKDFKYEWIWQKERGTGFLNANKQPLRDHENVLVFYRKQCTYNPQFSEGKPYVARGNTPTLNYNFDGSDIVVINDGYRHPTTTLYFPRVGKKVHPTQKPVALFEYLIKTYTNEGDLVLDCCAGSGTTGLAAKSCNRNYIMIELDDKFVEIARERVKDADMVS